MKKVIVILSIIVLSGLPFLPVLAEETESASMSELIETLREQIEELKAQIEAIQGKLALLRQSKSELKETTKEIKATLRLIRHLRFGMSGEDVELLQEILSTDPDVYPEGLVTGYFGPLTRNAVKRFQKMAGIEQAGVVGPKTMARINELLEEGAGESGKVPPGLLIAPGIRKKLGFTLNPLPGQVLPPGIAKKLGEGATSSEDDTPPVISEIMVSDITATSAKVSWLTDEETDSKVYYDTVTPLVVDDTTPMASSSDLVLSHEIELSGLLVDTTYYYLVNSSDEAGNNEISLEASFTTISELEQACLDSGGEVSTSSCCISTSDLPDLCAVGACGCAPGDSHEVEVCNCGTGQCFDGTACVAIE